jgi:quercetin dioxygenase-like cupin family protein
MGESWREIREISRDEMMKRIAFFKDLEGSNRGLPDSDIAGCERTLINVIGFQPPPSDEMTILSPVGNENSKQAAIPISEGFNVGYCRAKPGNGPLMHTHDTNETFIPMTGKWRCEWNDGEAKDFIDLDPLDVVSFPPGIARRFENVTHDEPEREHILLFIIGGDAPQAEFSTQANEVIEDWRAEIGQPG